MEGLNRGIFEIWEIIVVIALFLVVSSAIILLSNPDSQKAQLVTFETGFSSSLLKKNMEVTVDYPHFNNFKILNSGGKLFLQLNEKDKFNVNFIGQSPKIESDKTSFTLIKN